MATGPRHLLAAAIRAAVALAFVAGFATGPARAQSTYDLAVTNFTITPDPVPAGGMTTYDLDVQNSIGVDATNVTLNFTIPAKTRFSSVSPSASCSLTKDATDAATGTVTCNLGTLVNTLTGGGAPVHIQVVTKNDPNGVLITSGNTASVTAVATISADTTTAQDANPADNVASLTSTVTRGADLTFATFSAAPAPVVAGGIVTFTTIVKNLGPYTAADATVALTIPAGLTWQSSSGTSWSCTHTGQSATCTYSAATNSGASASTLTWTAKVTGAISGTVQATANVSSSTPDGNGANNTANAIVTVGSGTDLAVTKSVNQTPIPGNSTPVFTLNAQNLGPNSANTVTLTDTIPSMFANVAVTNAGGWACSVNSATASGTPVSCARSVFAVGSDPVTISATAPNNAWITANPGTYTNSATIASATTDPAPGNNTGSTSFTFKLDGADLAINSSRGSLPITINTPFPTTISVKSNGPRAATGNIYATYQLSSNETLVSFSGGSWSCSPTGSSGVLVTCQMPGGLAVGATTPTLTLNTQVSSAITSVANTVCTSTGAGFTPPEGDINPGNDCTQTGGVQISNGSATLSVSKSGSSTSLAFNADTLTYTITVTNSASSPNDATHVTIEDTLAMYVAAFQGRPSTTYAISSAPAGTVCSGGALGTFISGNSFSCDVGTLSPGTSATITVDVKRPMLDGSWTNTACAYSKDVGTPSESKTCKPSSNSTTVDALTDVQVTQKTVNPTSALAGTNVVYTIQVRNNGPSAAANVKLTDTFDTPAGNGTFTLISASSADAGASCDTAMSAGNSISCSFGNVPYQGVRTMTLTIRPDWMASPPANRQFTNTAVVTTDTPQSDTSNDQLSATLNVLPAQVDLLVHGSHSPDPVTWAPQPQTTQTQYNQNYAIYDVSATNNGPSYATGVNFVDSYVSASPAGNTLTFQCDLPAAPANLVTPCAGAVSICTGPANGPISCAPDKGYGAGNLKAGDTVHRFLVYKVDQEPSATGTTYQKTVTVSGNETETNSANNTNADLTTVRVMADAQVVSKTPTPATVDVGQPFTWTIVVGNNGPGTSHATTLTDTLPASMVLTGAPTTTYAGGTCTGATGGTSFTCSLGDVAYQATATVTVPVVLTTPFNGTSISNTATVSTTSIDLVPANNKNTGTVTVNLATISGDVYVDQNDNGVRDTGEVGINAVTVKLTGKDFYGNTISLTTQTNSSGKFTFTNLPPSDSNGYTLTETQPSSYLDGKESVNGTPVVNSDVPGNPANDVISGIVLAASKQLAGYQFGEVSSGTIAGKVWHDQNNNGLIDNGEATFIAGVKIDLSGVDDRGNSVSATANTSSSGAYSFTGLRPGAYTLNETQPAGYLPGRASVGTGANGFGAATTGTADNTPANATFGNIIANIGLRSGDVAINYNFGEVKAATLAGMVFYDINNNGTKDAAPSETGIAGAAVTLTGTDYRGNALSLPAATTANDGTYQFTNVPPSSSAGYALTEVVPAGYGNGKLTVGNLGGTAAAGVLTASDATGTDKVNGIVIASGATGTGYNFGEQKASISGTVFNDPNNNGLQDSGDTGIPNVTITLTGCGANQTTATDSQGNYIFSGLAACASYAVTETQPSGYSNGKTIPGSVGGIVSSTATTDTIGAINLSSTTYAISYNFAEHGEVNTDLSCTSTSPAASPAASHAMREPFNWTFSVQVSAAQAASPNTVFSDTLPAGLELTGVPTSTLGACTGAKGQTAFSCSPGYLMPGQSATITVPVRVISYPAGGNLTNTATVTTDGKNTHASNACSGALTVLQSTLSGTVFSDPNNNGVLDTGEKGIASVAIALTGKDAYGNDVSLTTATAADGTYQFTGLAPASPVSGGAGGYTVTETQPPAFAEGKTIAGSLGGSVVTDVISQVPVTAGIDATGYNFAEIAQGLAGTVYVDLNRNGKLDPGEPGIANVTLTVTGTDNASNPVNQSVVTASDGTYLFGGLAPSNAAGYTLTETQPAIWADGQVTAGSAGGTAGVNVVTSLVLPPGKISTGYNFGEVGSQLCGYVYEDLNNNGIKDANEAGVPGVSLTLSGSDANGNPVNQTTTTAQLLPTATDPGRYCFTNLPVPGGSGYTITETPPPNSTDGIVSPGNIGGVAGKEVISQVKFTTAGANGDGYNFAILIAAPSSLSGFVWLDANHDRARNEQTGRGTWTVQLVRGDPTTVTGLIAAAGNAAIMSRSAASPKVAGAAAASGPANVIAATTTAPDGSYKFSGLPPGTNYSVVFRSPNGGYVYGYIPNITLLPNTELTEQNQPLDPSGVVYDAVTRNPVAGAVVTLSGPPGFDPATQLLGGVANVSQTTAANGEYKYLLLPGAVSGTYTLQVGVPSGYMQRVSTAIPPCAGPLTVGNSPAPALVQTTNAAPGVSIPLQTAGACPTTSSGLAAGAGTSQYFLSLVLSAASANVINNHIPIEPVPTNTALIVTKSTPKTDIARGDLVPYTVTVRNNLDIAQTGISIVDLMPPGFKYRDGSASINGVRKEPAISGRQLTWGNQTISLTTPTTIKMLLIASAATSDGEFTNEAWATNGFTNTVISNIAKAVVRITPDPTFDCSDIIGKVFDDANRNGYPDPGEKGIANVRVVTVNGQIVTTDAEGRFHIACADVPNELRGSNYILKLDPRSLPTGYRITTENPLSVRLTRGKMAKMNFGAALHRVVRIDVMESAFLTASTKLQPRWMKSLEQVLPTLENEKSVLRIAYSRSDNEDPALAQQRVESLTRFLRDGWARLDEPYDLAIETEIVSSSETAESVGSGVPTSGKLPPASGIKPRGSTYK